MDDQGIDHQPAKARSLLSAYLPMEDKHWEGYKQGFHIRKYRKGDFILKEGETENYLSILLSGITWHYVLVRGKRSVLTFSFSMN